MSDPKKSYKEESEKLRQKIRQMSAGERQFYYDKGAEEHMRWHTDQYLARLMEATARIQAGRNLSISQGEALEYNMRLKKAVERHLGMAEDRTPDPLFDDKFVTIMHSIFALITSGAGPNSHLFKLLMEAHTDKVLELILRVECGESVTDVAEAVLLAPRLRRVVKH